MNVYASKRIAAPIERVWQIVADPASMDQWSPVENDQLGVHTDGDLTGVGSRLIRRYLDQQENEIGSSIVDVTEFDAPRRLALSAVEPDQKMTFTIQLDADDDGTTLVGMRNSDQYAVGVFGLFNRRAQRGKLTRMLKRLRDMAEEAGS